MGPPCPEPKEVFILYFKSQDTGIPAWRDWDPVIRG